MKRWHKGWLGLAAALLAGGAQAFCGFYAGKADASLFNEASQVIVVRDGNRTVLSMLNDYKGELSNFALVVPTPVTLQQGQVRIAEKLSFERLDAYSSPRLAEYHDSNPCRINFTWGQEPMRYRGGVPMPSQPYPMPQAAPAAASSARLGVTVELQYTLGEYDIVSLSATQSDGLETWLRQNGYRIPKGASSALKPYINQGMKFFVARVNLAEQSKTGYTNLRPLQFAYESEKFMLPMRLGMVNAPPGKAQDLIVYLLSKEGRVESSNYRTVKLPANVNLPFFVKPRFQDFYKAMFDNEARKESHKVVFTEYFWDMAWCDPCAANPLSAQELRNAGVFWVGGDENAAFRAMAAPATGSNARAPAVTPIPPGGGSQPVVLTRLHVRYTPETFPEDLMFTQTRDRQNWQTRYVIQNPYAGSVAQCGAEVARFECASQCSSRVNHLWTNAPKMSMHGRETLDDRMPAYSGLDESDLQAACLKACEASKQGALNAAAQYYERQLPERIAQEKRRLAQLTGWGLAEIDRMPGAERYSAGQPPATAAAPERGGWRALFGTRGG